MKYMKFFVYISITVVIYLLVVHQHFMKESRNAKILVNMLEVHRQEPQIVSGGGETLVLQIENATFTERATDQPKKKCHLPFNCNKGANPPFEPTLQNMSFTDLKLLYPDVKPGGNWSPEDCDPGQRVAIIIPYRNREEHLKLFLANIIPFLKMQRKAFTVFIVEQAGDVLFNRASLLNIGYTEALKLGNYSCFIFHDVDMIPIRLCNLYECYASEAMHMGVSRNRDPPRLVYSSYMGGVLSLHRNHMAKINGFSNIFFGWGGEDDEVGLRLQREKIKVRHRPAAVGNYIMPKHERDAGNPDGSRSSKQLIANPNYRQVDGLSSLSYTFKELVLEPLYTTIVVDIEGPKPGEDVKAYFVKEVDKLKQKLANGGK